MPNIIWTGAYDIELIHNDRKISFGYDQACEKYGTDKINNRTSQFQMSFIEGEWKESILSRSDREMPDLYSTDAKEEEEEICVSQIIEELRSMRFSIPLVSKASQYLKFHVKFNQDLKKKLSQKEYILKSIRKYYSFLKRQSVHIYHSIHFFFFDFIVSDLTRTTSP